MAPWSNDAPVLDDLMTQAQMSIKDRATQRTLHFGSELQALESACDQATNTARQKDAQLGELNQLTAQFGDRKDDLVRGLVSVQDRLLAAKAGKSDLQGLKDLVREIEVSVNFTTCIFTFFVNVFESWKL